MKLKSIFSLIIVLFINSCVSVKQYNNHIDEAISTTDLKKDVDYVQKKLKRYHPKLDLYNTKEEIDFKFDSFKKTIDKPLRPNEFYVKFFPIFSNLGHGHTDLYPLFKRLEKVKNKKYKNSKSAFMDFSFLWRNDSVFLVKDYSKTNPIVAGAELIAIDGYSMKDLYNKYNKSIYGDGFNTTFRYNIFNRTFLNYITLEQGLKDSVEFTFLVKNEVVKKKSFRTFSKPKVQESVKKDTILTKVVKQQQRELRLKQKRYGYNKATKSYSKNLYFPTNDSTIAVLKITDFKRGKTKELYKSVFSDIEKYKVKNLILDIRDNGGGYIEDAHYLYAYLVEDSKPFLGSKIVASKASFGKTIYRIFPIPSYPLLWLGSGYTYFATTKNSNQEYELHVPFSFTNIKKELIYKNNLYVMINGGSYSASSLVSSNLQIKNRAYFVGEETGGDFNGTVAGLMPKFTLPHSKLTMSVGTVYLSPIEKREEIGHGNYPNKEVKPSLQSKIKGQDLELRWILNDIKNGNLEYNKLLKIENHLPN